VIDGGRIVEDGAPRHLAVEAGSRYGAMLAAENVVRSGTWGSTAWRRFHLRAGVVTEIAADSESKTTASGATR
jgi:hypothetical protein